MYNLRQKLALWMAIPVFLAGVAVSVHAQAADNAPRKIVVFQENFVNEPAQAALVQKFGALVNKSLPLINGLAVLLPPQAEQALLRRGEVLRIDDDLVIRAVAKPAPAPQPAQELPWGIDRVEADKAGVTGAGIKVAILDTGIDLDHPDLKNNIKGNVNIISSRRSGNDDNGHGTHVAGTVAGVNNGIGVVGVGSEIGLYAVKVLDKTGNGWLSNLIAGLDWCINNSMQVINMSIGASSENQSFHDAIIRTYQAGIIQVAAAGNNGGSTGTIDYPGRYAETIAVSALGQNTDGSLYFAGFSSYGTEVDVAAPGVGVKSTYHDGYYRILSGTSMATPHVSGIAALVLAAKGPMHPDTMKAHLRNTAESLGLPPYEVGAGLVRADLAVE